MNPHQTDPGDEMPEHVIERVQRASKRIVEGYSIKQLAEKVGKYFNARFNSDDEEQVKLARDKVYQMEYDDQGRKRSRQQIRERSRRFQKSVKRNPRIPKRTAIVALLLSLGLSSCERDCTKWETNPNPINPLYQDCVEREGDADTSLQMYRYPDGSTGSLSHGWETGQRGEPIQ